MEPNKHRKAKVVYTYGVFDLFHKGHVELLKEAKMLGDSLVVGIFSDDVAASFKRKPVLCLEDRMHVVKHCQYVDEVVVQEHFSPEHVIRKIKPHVLAKGPGAGWEERADVPGTEAMREIGGSIVRLPYHDGISTSMIIQAILEG